MLLLPHVADTFTNYKGKQYQKQHLHQQCCLVNICRSHSMKAEIKNKRHGENAQEVQGNGEKKSEHSIAATCFCNNHSRGNCGGSATDNEQSNGQGERQVKYFADQKAKNRTKQKGDYCGGTKKSEKTPPGSDSASTATGLVAADKKNDENNDSKTIVFIN